MTPILFATLHLILVHTVSGAEIYVNIDEITSVRDPTEDNSPDDLLSHNVNCILGMTNGKFISTKEVCKEIILKLAQYDKYPEQTK